MKNRFFLILCTLLGVLLFMQEAHAQIEVKLEPTRRQYLLGENIIMRVSIQNMTDEVLTLDNYPNRSWLNFLLTRQPDHNYMPMTTRPLYSKVVLQPGQRAAFEANIRPYFNFDREGQHKAIATILMPDGKTTFSSGRASFNITSGTSLKSYTIQHKGRKLKLHGRMLRIADKDSIFGQVVDAETNKAIGACYLGPFLNFFQPQFMIDGAQNLHMLCQSTPTLFCYAVMDTQGKRLKRHVMQRTGGPVSLRSSAKGIAPVGLKIHVPAKPEDNIPNVTDRPF